MGLLDDVLMFTVQILHPKKRRAIGAGLLATQDTVVTCAHVLAGAGIELGWELRDTAPEDRVTVPLRLLNGEGWQGEAYPVSWLYGLWHDDSSPMTWYDDIAVLTIKGEPPGRAFGEPLAPGRLRSFAGHAFRSVGFPRLVGGRALHIDGRLVGLGPHPRKAPGRQPLIQLRSNQLPRRGMSGAPVYDTTDGQVVGLIEQCVLKRKGLGYGFGIAWAVNCNVLALPPFLISLDTEPRGRQYLPSSVYTPELVRSALTGPLRDEYPQGWRQQAGEFVGRGRLLRHLVDEMDDPDRRMVGLIGFGGEGKSSLAQQLVARRGQRSGGPVVWWDFRVDGGPELFFEWTLDRFVGNHLDLGPEPSPAVRMEALFAVAQVQPCVFVLESVESQQKRDAAGFGRITDDNLRNFLLRLASKAHVSFCLLTSRLPFRDLCRADRRAYREYGVGRLTTREGRKLLVDRGVHGPVADLDALVEAWHGHALSLDLLARLASQRMGGRIARAAFETPGTDLPSDVRVDALLDFYDGHLTPTEREALTILSAFRVAVAKNQFLATLGALRMHDPQSPDALRHLLDELIALGVVRRTPEGESLALHPLVGKHYRKSLAAQPPEYRAVLHDHVADQYLRNVGETGAGVELRSLVPLIESVHHLCGASRFDDALRIYQDRVELGSTMRLSYQLNAYDTVSSLMDSFWVVAEGGREAGRDGVDVVPDADNTHDVRGLPQTPARRLALRPGPGARYIVNRKAVALMNTGRLAPAAELFEQAMLMGEGVGDVLGATQSAENLAEVSFYLGELDRMERSARRALTLATGLSSPAREEEVRDSSCHLGMALALMGRSDEAQFCFDKAVRIQCELAPDTPFLADIWGISYAEFLRRRGDRGAARAVVEANLHFAHEAALRDNVSICHRLLGQLEADDGRIGLAWKHLGRAVEQARELSERTVLLEALSSRARYSARWGQPEATMADLKEAADYATSGSYALVVFDLDVSRAWYHLQQRHYGRVRKTLDHCRREAARLRYAWGLEDLEEVAHALPDTPQSHGQWNG
ncbi:trypsin-like peptidase domain-containing protein [Streptomyces mirabilis]|uniref:trypsin-like peptidase domain-containing protein n=1 Tax=Streptomyces mirabilis TaxID=68239 RepID=UPI00368AE84C